MSGASSSRIDEERAEPQEYVALTSQPVSKATVGGACQAFRSSLCLLVIALLLAGIVFLIWPTSPKVEVTEIHLDGIDIKKEEGGGFSIPSLSLTISLKLFLQITNYNVFGVKYETILVHIFYRGDEIGQVKSAGGLLSAKSANNATATLELQSKEILENAGDLWDDVSNRSVPFKTLTEFSGTVDLLFFHPHILVNTTCELVVDPEEKVILSQDCDMDF